MWGNRAATRGPETVDGTGFPVPDGTVVQFFTTLGRIQEQGKTNDGVARVNLTSDSRSGTAEVTAFSGEATGSESVEIGAVRPRTVIVRAEPSIITNSRSSHIIATVLDENGDPVPNLPVVFSLPATNNTEFLDSSGQPVFTNNNGEAEDVLRTRRTAGAVGSVEVTATPLSSSLGKSGSTTVQLQLQ